jgi:hypothetical protein
VLHDLWVGIERGERPQIFLSPPSQNQTSCLDPWLGDHEEQVIGFAGIGFGRVWLTRRRIVVGVIARWFESDPAGSSALVDPIAPAVDDNVMMKPTQCEEILRFRLAVFGPREHVVGLKPISAHTTLGHTTTVAMQDESAQLRGDHPALPTHTEWDAFFGPDDFEKTGASNQIQHAGTDRRATCNFGAISIHEHGHQWHAPATRGRAYIGIDVIRVAAGVGMRGVRVEHPGGGGFGRRVGAVLAKSR